MLALPSSPCFIFQFLLQMKAQSQSGIMQPYQCSPVHKQELSVFIYKVTSPTVHKNTPQIVAEN